MKRLIMQTCLTKQLNWRLLNRFLIRNLTFYVNYIFLNFPDHIFIFAPNIPWDLKRPKEIINGPAHYCIPIRLFWTANSHMVVRKNYVPTDPSFQAAVPCRAVRSSSPLHAERILNAFALFCSLLVTGSDKAHTLVCTDVSGISIRICSSCCGLRWRYKTIPFTSKTLYEQHLASKMTCNNLTCITCVLRHSCYWL